MFRQSPTPPHRKQCCARMFWGLLVIVIALWSLAEAWRKRKLWKAMRKFKNDLPAYPVIGHAYIFLGSSEDRMKGLMRLGKEAIKHGGLANAWLGQQGVLMVADAVNAEFLLKAFLEKDQAIMRFTQQVTRNGLIFAPVSIWRPRRKLIAPLFSQRALNGFVRVFAAQAAVLAARMRAAADGRDFSVWKYYSAYTFDSICETNMGIHLKAQHKEHPFVQAFGTAAALIAERMLQPWQHADAVYALMPQRRRIAAAVGYIYDFVGKLIQDKRQELAEKKKNPDYEFEKSGDEAPNFLQMLIESNLSDEGKSEEVVVVLSAGTDTSAVAASYATVLLAHFPEEQEKVYNELKEVVGDSDRALTYEDLPKLKYLEAFLKETLRLYPPVPVTVRYIDQDVELPSGETVVAGMSMCLHIWAIHRNPRYWGADAAQFRPGRFLEGPLQHPAQFMPFSYGMRNCIGYQYAMMSLKTALATVVRRYRVRPSGALSATELRAPLRSQYDVMMKHVDDFVVQLLPRN